MPNEARTQEDFRKTVCFLCMRKCDRELTDFMIARVLKLVKSDLKFEDERVPRGVCNTCRILLQKRDNGDLNSPLPPLYNFYSIVIKPLTRTANRCECLICQISRLNLNQQHPIFVQSSSKQQTKEKTIATPGTSSANQQPPSAEKRCTQCLSIIARGHRHFCTPGTRHRNLLSLVQDDINGAEQIAVSVIANKEAFPHETVRLSHGTGGKLFPVTPGNI